VLAVEGRLDESLTELQLATRTDPLSPRIHRTLAMVLAYVARYDEAAEYCDSAPAAGECLVRDGQGRTRETADLLERDPALNRNPQARGMPGYAYAQSGHLFMSTRSSRFVRSPRTIKARRRERRTGLASEWRLQGGIANRPACPVTPRRTRRGRIHSTYCSLAYSARACLRIGMSTSASFQSVRKSS
jgi:hypothetical protein